MDKLQAMQLFVRVIERGSFSQVAREQGISQSTVSKQIAALENRLKTKLINRTTRNLSLTDAGTDYYEGCLRLLSELAQLEQKTADAERHPSGQLRVSTSLSFGRLHIVPHVPAFLAAYPDIELELRMDARRVDLVAEGLDLAIRIGSLEDSRIVAKPIGRSVRILVASPEYVAQHPTLTSVSDLHQHNCLGYSLGDLRRWRFRTHKGDETIQVAGNLSTNNMDSLHDTARCGLGIAMLPHWLVREDLETGRLQQVLPDTVSPPVEINALYLQNPNLPSKVRCFLDFFSARISTHPDFC